MSAGGHDIDTAQLVAELALDALRHARHHGDTKKIVRLLSALPQEGRWQYVTWIKAHSPVHVWGEKGQVFAKLRAKDHIEFREFALVKAARAVPGVERRFVHERSELFTPAEFAQKLGQIKGHFEGRPHQELRPAMIKRDALEALSHAYKHGDVGPMARLIMQLPHGFWERGFRSWLYMHSPIRRNGETGRLFQAKRDSADFCDYDLVAAAAADIQPNRTTFKARRLLDDQSFSQWVHRLSFADHLEILTAFEDCVSGIVAENLQDGPVAQKVFRAFASEWRARTDMNDYFRWPDIQAEPGQTVLSAIHAPEIGIFAALGYRVGKVRGQPDAVRLFLLDQIFASVLPPVNDADYMRPWGLPGTATRLRKMAYFLASEIKNAKRKVAQDMSVAIADWRRDYRYLYDKYYVDRFKFALPSLSLDRDS